MMHIIDKNINTMINGVVEKHVAGELEGFIVIVKTKDSVDSMVSDNLKFYDAVAMLEITKDTVMKGFER